MQDKSITTLEQENEIMMRWLNDMRRQSCYFNLPYLIMGAMVFVGVPVALLWVWP